MRIVDEKLLDQFRAAGPCSWCREHCQRREPHHIHTRGIGGGGRLDVAINLVSLCLRCHRSHHDGNEPLTCDLKAIVAAREGRLQDDIEAEIVALRKRRKQ
jgi:hypothetical protein